MWRNKGTEGLVEWMRERNAKQTPTAKTGQLSMDLTYIA
jgi:erythromycin esterase-like protein